VLFAQAADKPNLVLLPIEVEQNEYRLESEYGSALQEGLQKRYRVFYGAEVEKKLEKEYQKKDCNAESCRQNVAIAFNGELIADASVKRVADGYVLKLKIQSILSGEAIETRTEPCAGCNELAVIALLKQIGANEKIEAAGSRVVANGSAPRAVQTNQAAILIFDSQPSGAEVMIDGKTVGKTPYQGLSHTLGDTLSAKVLLAGYRPYDMSITLNQPITQLEPLKLELGQAFVTIVTDPFTPDAVVYVDGQAQGKAPLQLTLNTAAHEIHAQADSRKTDVQSIRLDDGENKQVILAFARSASTALGMTFVDIPGGSFRMGSNDGGANEKPVRRVTIAPFKMMTTEVTQQQWQAVMGENPSRFKDCGPNCPVEQVSWNDIQTFLQKLNQQSGETYRLPSEAEWEYAARAGSTTRYSWGDEIGSGKANCDGCGSRWDNKTTAPVMSFQPNAFGLYDMHGNVWEWTQDCWNDNYNGAPSDGRAWTSGNCAGRVLRGGSWSFTPIRLRSAYRYRFDTDYRYFIYGLRLARDL
jgi:formylglycine-generating enzyme required for sulfatase activity